MPSFIDRIRSFIAAVPFLLAFAFAAFKMKARAAYDRFMDIWETPPFRIMLAGGMAVLSTIAPLLKISWLAALVGAVWGYAGNKSRFSAVCFAIAWAFISWRDPNATYVAILIGFICMAINAACEMAAIVDELEKYVDELEDEFADDGDSLHRTEDEPTCPGGDCSTGSAACCRKNQ